MKYVLIILIVIFITSCPTPFGIMYGDSIMHYNGDSEKIEEWVEGTNPWIDDTEEEKEEKVDITIELDWGE